MTREERWTIRKSRDEVYDTRGASIVGPRTDPRTVEVVPAARLAEVEGRVRAALSELGVPTDDYPAPVANAVEILRGTDTG